MVLALAKVVCFLIVALLTLLFYNWIKARNQLQRIVLVEDRKGQPKQIPQLTNPLLGFPLMLYQTVIKKQTDFERFLDILDKPGPLKSYTTYILGQTWVITWNPELCSEVYSKPDTDVWGKVGPEFSYILFDLAGKSIVSVRDVQWKKQRTLLKSGFRISTLKGLLPGFQVISNTLCHHLDAACGNGVFQPHFWMSKTTIDALGTCGFGMDFDALNGKLSEIYQAYEGILESVGNPLFMSKLYANLPHEANRKYRESKENFFKWCRITVQKQLERMKEGSERTENLLDTMIEAHFSENPQLDENELLHNIFFFFMAGHETTSGTLSFILDQLARHHDVQQKCREEIQSLFTLGEEPTYEKIKKLQYLNRVISETMRTRPLVPRTTRQAKKDTNLLGYFIPKGTIIMSAIGNLHHDPDIWEDPMTFNPDRWIEKQKHHSTPHFMPFGAGPRICLGMNFANLEIRVVLVNLLLRYQFDVNEKFLRLNRTLTLVPQTDYTLKISHL